MLLISAAMALSCPGPSFDVDLDAVPANGVLGIEHRWGPPDDLRLRRDDEELELEVLHTPRYSRLHVVGGLRAGEVHELTVGGRITEFVPTEEVELAPPPVPVIESLRHRAGSGIDGFPWASLDLVMDSAMDFEVELTQAGVSTVVLGRGPMLSMGKGRPCSVDQFPGFEPMVDSEVTVWAVGPTGLRSEPVSIEHDVIQSCSTASGPPRAAWLAVVVLLGVRRR